MALKQKSAEVVAIGVVQWLAESEDLLPVFLGSSGLTLPDLQQRIADPDFLAAVMDFVLMDDQWVLASSAYLSVNAEEIVAARQALPGGDTPHFT